MQRPYTILWYSVSCLLDTSNGAAISNKFILEKLASMGVKVVVLCTTAMDNPSGSVVYDRIAQQTELKSEFYRDFNLNNIHYYIVNTEGGKLDLVRQEEQNNLWNLYVRLLDAYEPDLMMGFAPDLFSLSLRREAKARGISTAYALCNASHECFRFPDCDLVFTNSYALCKTYDEMSGHSVDVKHFGICIDPNRVVAQRRNPNPIYITYVNPSQNKGLAIFLRMSSAFKERHPDSPLRFLVVKNRSDYSAAVQSLHYKNGDRYVTQENQQAIMSNVDVAEHTEAMDQVYAISKVVVVPSLCNEAWGMVATEANLNGLPVIANDHGGLPEAIGRQVTINADGSASYDDSALGGVLVTAPQSCRDDNCVIPDDDEIAPYLDALETILANYDHYVQQANAAAQLNSCDNALQRLINMLKPLLDNGQKNKHPSDSSFFLTPVFLDKIHKQNIEGTKQAQQHK